MFTWPRIAIFALAAAAIGWVVLELRAGARAQEQVTQLKAAAALDAAQDAIREVINAAEAIRLASEQADRETFWRLNDEAASDPTSVDPGLGVRSTQRLNTIR